MSIIEVKSITKRWGNNTVLKSVDLAVESSEIVGITGHNGSGKTVLMKCICGFITRKAHRQGYGSSQKYRANN